MTKRLFIREMLTNPDFFYVLAKHLDKIFPDGWTFEDSVVCAVDGTGGWAEALKKTCAELSIMDIYYYWNNLDWQASDILDEYISDLLCAVIFNENGQRVDC